MGRYLVKLEDYYFEWSTIVDAPVTWGMKLEEFKQHYKEMYGNEGMRRLDERLKRVEEKGTSALDHNSVEDVISGNRAGPDETELTVDEVFQVYCLRQPLDGWMPS